MVTFVTGIAGGLVATLVMAVTMMLSSDDSPLLSARLWAKYAGGGTPDQNLLAGMALHFVYGSMAGGVLSLVVDASGSFGSGVGVAWVVWGVIWAVVLFVGAVFWMRIVIGFDPNEAVLRTSGWLHLVYGVVLGAWLGFVGFP